jgi:hypothetical protein
MPTSIIINSNKQTTIAGDVVLKRKAILGLAIMLVGVAFFLYGVYSALTTEHAQSNIPKLVVNGFVPITIGIVLLIDGVVVQGFINYYALIIHLIANIPYALAIMGINNLGQQTNPPTNPQEYITATLIYWIIGVIFNLGGIVANHFAKK